MTGTFSLAPRLRDTLIHSSRRSLICLLALSLAIAGLPVRVVLAQGNSQDFEAPLIEHEVIARGTLGETQVFSANVVDNLELKEVTLFYRFAGDETFEQIRMQPVASSSFYSANLATDQLPEVETSIEYYLQAEDTAGNIVLKGYLFDPLVRSLVSPGNTGALAADASAQGAQSTAQAPEKKSRTLYYIVGVIGLLALAGLAAGSGDDEPSGTVTPGCDPVGCQVNLVVSPP